MEAATLETGSARSLQDNRSVAPVLEKKDKDKCAKYERPRLIALKEHRKKERRSTPLPIMCDDPQRRDGPRLVQRD